MRSARHVPGVARQLALLATLASVAFLLVVGSASAAGPEWKLTVTPNADYFLSGQAPGVYKIEAENVGDAPTAGEVTLKDTVPAGLAATAVKFYAMAAPGAGHGSLEYQLSGNDFSELLCPSHVECVFPGELTELGDTSLNPGQRLIMFVLVGVPAGVEGQLEDLAKISGGGATPDEAGVTNAASESPGFGILHFGSSLTDSSGQPYTQAGGHPYQFTANFDFETYSSANESEWQNTGTEPVYDPKYVISELPPGLIANPQAVPRCTLASFFTQECERNKVSVGTAGLRLFGTTEGKFRVISPIFNLQPTGAYPGQLGIVVGGLPIAVITSGVRTASDYGVTAASLTVQAALTRVYLTLWGVPAAAAHNRLRGKECQGIFFTGTFDSAAMDERECEEEEGFGGGGGPAEVPATPFLTLPTECSGNPLTSIGSYDSWQAPGEYATDSVTSPAVDGCNGLDFNPKIEVRPTTDLAGAPSGLEFDLHVPQNENPEGVATAELKEAVLKLPEGLTLNPSSSEGLTGCSEGQLGLHAEAPAHCPDASKLGTAEVHTALLDEPLDGSLYLATPHRNPFGALLAGYIVLEGQGVKIKLPGRFETDPTSGQITARFAENPQLPFEDLKLDVFGGARGPLRTPAVCSAYEATSTLTPYSAPESGPPAEPVSEFETTVGTGGEGSPCPSASPSEEPNAPAFHAGTESTQAGTYSPFSLKLVREDGSQEIKAIETTLPPGLVGKLAGVGECPQRDLEAAEHKTGAEEQQSPSCPPSSEVGTVDVASGVGPTPLNVSGHAYLAGPYKGAALSLAIVTPAVAGPFDLGDVVVKTALYVNPETAQITAKSDEIPTILEGIPLDVRSITLKLSRPNFTLNPTNCEPLSITGSVLSVQNASAPLNQRFQAGGCPALPFAPKLAFSLKGGTKRNQNPALTATLTARPGEANVAKAQVTLPPSEFVDNAHIQNPCTQVQFAEGKVPGEKCPPSSVLGYAKAETPLLEAPLEGPVYFRSNGGARKLPDMVAALNGEIDVALDGHIDTGKGGGVRNTFEVVPDAPVSKFTLSLLGGNKGLIVNSRNLCQSANKASADLTGQNGKLHDTEPLIKVKCRKKGGKHAKHNHRAARRHLR